MIPIIVPVDLLGRIGMKASVGAGARQESRNATGEDATRTMKTGDVDESTAMMDLEKLEIGIRTEAGARTIRATKNVEVAATTIANILIAPG